MIEMPKMTREQAIYELSKIIARLSAGCTSANCCNKHDFLHLYAQQNGSLPCYCSVYQVGMDIKSIGERLRGEGAKSACQEEKWDKLKSELLRMKRDYEEDLEFMSKNKESRERTETQKVMLNVVLQKMSGLEER